MKRFVLASFIILGILCPAVPAAAAGDPFEYDDARISSKEATSTQARIPSVTYVHELVNRSKETYWTNKSQKLGFCYSENGGTCTISKGTTSTRTFQGELEIPVKRIAAIIGISQSTSVSVSVSCTSPKLKKDQRWVAWPVGSNHKYKVKRTAYYGSKVIEVKTGSNFKYTFNPYQNGFKCGIG